MRSRVYGPNALYGVAANAWPSVTWCRCDSRPRYSACTRSCSETSRERSLVCVALREEPVCTCVHLDSSYKYSRALQYLSSFYISVFSSSIKSGSLYYFSRLLLSATISSSPSFFFPLSLFPLYTDILTERSRSDKRRFFSLVFFHLLRSTFAYILCALAFIRYTSVATSPPRNVNIRGKRLFLSMLSVSRSVDRGLRSSRR